MKSDPILRKAIRMRLAILDRVILTAEAGQDNSCQSWLKSAEWQYDRCHRLFRVVGVYRNQRHAHLIHLLKDFTQAAVKTKPILHWSNAGLRSLWLDMIICIKTLLHTHPTHPLKHTHRHTQTHRNAHRNTHIHTRTHTYTFYLVQMVVSDSEEKKFQLFATTTLTGLQRLWEQLLTTTITAGKTIATNYPYNNNSR